MSVPKIVVHTDVFLGHLVAVRQPSVLRQAMGKFFCYATVFHAIELFSLARSKQEEKAIEDAMSAVKVLGLNPKNARAYAGAAALTTSRQSEATYPPGAARNHAAPARGLSSAC